jgi:hypothetical protein
MCFAFLNNLLIAMKFLRISWEDAVCRVEHQFAAGAEFGEFKSPFRSKYFIIDSFYPGKEEE